MLFPYKVNSNVCSKIEKIYIHYKESNYPYQKAKAWQSEKQPCFLNAFWFNHINAQIPYEEFGSSTQNLIKKYSIAWFQIMTTVL